MKILGGHIHGFRFKRWRKYNNEIEEMSKDLDAQYKASSRRVLSVLNARRLKANPSSERAYKPDDLESYEADAYLKLMEKSLGKEWYENRRKVKRHTTVVITTIIVVILVIVVLSVVFIEVTKSLSTFNPNDYSTPADTWDPTA